MRNLTSVIITSHNYGKFIGECIDSMLNQTVSAKEIIVINDASEDDTDDAVKIFDQKIQYYKVNYHNAQKTRNFGLSRSTGKYIVFLDADDYLDKSFLEKMQRELENDPDLFLVYSDRCNIGDDDVKKKYHILNMTRTFEYSYFLLNCVSYISLPALIRKEHFGGFDDKIKRGQDWDAWLTYLKGGRKAKRYPEPIYHCRFHGKNMTFQKNGFSDIMNVYRKHNPCWMIPFLIFGAKCAGAINRVRNTIY